MAGNKTGNTNIIYLFISEKDDYCLLNYKIVKKIYKRKKISVIECNYSNFKN